jgi:hypothetical protein
MIAGVNNASSSNMGLLASGFPRLENIPEVDFTGGGGSFLGVSWVLFRSWNRGDWILFGFKRRRKGGLYSFGRRREGKMTRFIFWQFGLRVAGRSC